jgi:hypothetical protein
VKLPFYNYAIAAILISIVFGLLFSRLPAKDNAQLASSIRAHEARIMSLSIGCQNSDDLQQARALLARYDFQNISDFSRAHGCRLFEIGQTGRVADVSSWSATSCIRTDDDEKCFWLPTAVVQRK